MAPTVSTPDVESFYKTALIGLRWLEAHETTGRRFGPEADARWKGFAGHLTPTDRMDLLLRDAAVVWGAAFSPAVVFRLPGLASDEPFGPDWPVVAKETAKRLWREAQTVELGSWKSVWALVLEAWKTDPSGDGVEIGALTPATRLLVAGPSALDACLAQFAQREELSWSDQVVVAAEAPTTRHLAGLAGLFVRKRAATRLVPPAESSLAPSHLVKQAGISIIDRVVISKDAEPGEKSFAAAATDVRAS
jgi:hypothetical protein